MAWRGSVGLCPLWPRPLSAPPSFGKRRGEAFGWAAGGSRSPRLEVGVGHGHRVAVSYTRGTKKPSCSREGRISDRHQSRNTQENSAGPQKIYPLCSHSQSFLREGSRKRGVTKKDRRMCEGAAQRGPRPIAAHPHLPARPHHWPGAWERLMSQKGSVLYFCFYCGVWM